MTIARTGRAARHASADNRRAQAGRCGMASILRRAVVGGIAAVFGWLWAAAPCLAQASAPTSLLFVHVNVAPMDRDRILRDQSVLVEGGAITAMGKSIAPPTGARVIDGHGVHFLSPGLADMHQHADSSRDMAVYLANGVTTVLNMGEARSQFVARLRPAVNSGQLPGPQIFAAFRVDGVPDNGIFVITSPAQAREIVDLAKTNGYDFIKVYNGLSSECFYALVEAGRAAGIPVIGHGVTKVGVERQLAAGQVMVAHTEEYLYTVFFSPGSDPGDQAPRLDQIPAAVAFTKRAGAFVTADLNTYANIARLWGKPAALDEALHRPEVRYLGPEWRVVWRQTPYVQRTGDLSARLAFLKAFTVALSDAGVPLIAGTDAPIPGLVPGFSLHQDLRALEQAGLSRFQVLSTATRTPGEFIARTKPGARPFGTVAVGSRADLVLTAGNPLEDLSTLAHPLAVVAAGRWYSAADLQAMLDRIAADYDAAALK